jgi:hypothetical protein
MSGANVTCDCPDVVNLSPLDTVEKIFSTCRRTLGSKTWGRVLAAMDEELTTESFPDRLAPLIESMCLPGYIADLARLEWMLHQKKAAADDPNSSDSDRCVKPHPHNGPRPLEKSGGIHPVERHGCNTAERTGPCHPLAASDNPGKLHYREARDIDLLALKLIVEQIDPKEAANWAR